ncbi:hypothetical protein ABIE09_004486 [Lysobacter enzymogenes]|uniref:hypothetical protein n=1 Tax=Lysobacter enzymogenes TaxID=69 RepID=UPI0033945DD7
MKLVCKLHHPAISPSSANYELPNWPPKASYPIAIAHNGKVVSRYGDDRWDLSMYSGRRDSISFTKKSKSGSAFSKAGVEELRQLVAWWMYGPRPVQSPSSIVTFGNAMRVLVAHCSEAGIKPSRLWRHPAVISRIAQSLRPATSEYLLRALHELYEWRDSLGFMILDKAGLRQLSVEMPKTSRKQTPYIPPRVWAHTVKRLKSFLDGYLEHKHGIEGCFNACLDAYEVSFGSMRKALSKSRKEYSAPFRKVAGLGNRYAGTFRSKAEEFGIADLIEHWRENSKQTQIELRVTALSNYLTQASNVAIAYILSFTGMRIEEALRLQHGCFEIEHDKHLGPIYLIRGPTTKTIKDPAALWVTSPSVAAAIQVLESVSNLRLGVLRRAGDPRLIDAEKLPLRTRMYEPWGPKGAWSTGLDIRINPPSYSDWKKWSPRLLDSNEMRITREDLDLARLVTPSLDPEKYAEGAEWHLTWHQLRRSIAVNMTGSGIVSDASLQYQLKHLCRAMSLYYSRGFSHVALNSEIKAEYIRATYQMLNAQLEKLHTDQFVSPFGKKHKKNMLKPLTLGHTKILISSAKSGLVSYRTTLLGGCLKAGDCAYGGIDNIVECGGGISGTPCADALFDRTKLPRLKELTLFIEARAAEADDNSPESESLAAQLRSLRQAIEVIS